MVPNGLVLLATEAGHGGVPAFEVRGWVTWIMIAGTIALSLMAIWKVIVPFAQACHRVISAIDVIFDIAQEFRPNSGSTLHDRMLRIDSTTAATSNRLKELWDYSHESKHDIVNALTHIAPGVDIIAGLAQKMGVRPKPMGDT